MMQVEESYWSWKAKVDAGWHKKREYGNLGKTKHGFNPSLDNEPLGKFGRDQQAEAEAAIDAAYAIKCAKIAAEDAAMEIPRDADGNAILLAKDGEETKEVKVDDDIYRQLWRKSVRINPHGYAITSNNVKIHHIVRAREQPHHVIDHDDHNKLNNKRSNLFSRTQRRNTNNQKGRSNTGISGISRVTKGSHKDLFHGNVQISRDPVRCKQTYFKTLEETIVWVDDIKRRRAAGEYGPYFDE